MSDKKHPYYPPNGNYFFINQFSLPHFWKSYKRKVKILLIKNTNSKTNQEVFLS